MKSARITILFLTAIILGNIIGTRFWGSSENASKDPAAAIVSVQNETLQIKTRTKKIGCKINLSLPDPDCTPGAVFPNMTHQEICVSGYTKTVRNVTASLKKKVYLEYGLTYPQPTGSYEVDHLIPLELGGSNDVSNLFPEAAAPTPGFHEKDLVENFLHDEVCAGNMGLIAAQNQIALDWTAVWNSLTPEEIKALKNRF